MPRTILLLAGVALIASACGGGSTRAPTTAEPATTVVSSAATTSAPAVGTTMPPTTTTSPISTTTTSTPTQAPTFELRPRRGPEPVVTVEEEGIEPRRVLAFSFEVGTAVTSEMISSFRTEQILNEFDPVESELTQTFVVETAIVEESADGWVVESTVLDVDSQTTDPGLEQTIDQLFAFLTGVSTYSLVAPNGGLVASDARQMQQFLEASSQTVDLSAITAVQPRLPDVPVGVGALWTVAVQVEQDTLAFQQVTTYQLVDREGDLVTLDVTVEMTLLNPESLAAGIDGGEIEFSSIGGGTMTLDLRRPVPVGATSTLVQDIVISGDSDGEAISYTTRNEFGFTIAGT